MGRLQEITSPERVTDLAALKKNGADVRCTISFEIAPVDFQHASHPFRAYIFLARYSGVAAGKPFGFRKCYARGCPHNLRPHVSQAVMIANKHLQRDYHRLDEAGLEMERKLFTLKEMVLKFEDSRTEHSSAMSLQDFIAAGRKENLQQIDVNLEYTPAVEYFALTGKIKPFLMAEFKFVRPGQNIGYERCLACYPFDKEEEEKQDKMTLANQRLTLLYEAFDQAAIIYEKRLYE